MAIPIIIPNGVLVRLVWTLGGSTQMINVLGGQVSGAFVNSQAIANSLGTAVKSGLASSGWGAKLATTTILQNVGIRDMRTANNAEYLDQGATAAGTGTGDALPPGTSFVVSLRTAKAGPSYRGRVFLGGITEAWNIANGTADPTIGTVGVAFVTMLQTSFNAQAITLAVASRPGPQIVTQKTYTYSDGSTKTTTHTQHSRTGQVNNVTAILARNLTWDAQRRRDAPGRQSSLLSSPVALEYV